MPDGEALCEESYKACMASRRARVEKVIAEAAPWETQQQLADKAGVSVDTVQRTLQMTAPAVDCNSDTPAEPKPPRSSKRESPAIEGFTAVGYVARILEDAFKWEREEFDEWYTQWKETRLCYKTWLLDHPSHLRFASSQLEKS